MPRSGSPRSDVGILSERLHEMLLKDQKKARAPPGMAGMACLWHDLTRPESWPVLR